MRVEGDILIERPIEEVFEIAPVIDSTYALRETPKAIGHVAGGHARGTVVIAIDQAAA